MVRVFVPPQALPWLRITCALAIGYFGIWVLAPGLASVLPLSSFEATAAAFLLSLLLFVPLGHVDASRNPSAVFSLGGTMRHPFRSSLRELHSSAGLVIGWFGFFIFLFGSISLYRSEITFWFQPETHGVAPASPGLEEKLGAAAPAWRILRNALPERRCGASVMPSERAPLPAVAGLRRGRPRASWYEP